MRVEVLLFAALRERARAERLVLDVPDGATVEDLLVTLGGRHPELGRLDHCRVAVDLEIVPASHPLTGAREIALIPPVSGGHDGRFLLLDRPLSLQAVIDAVTHDDVGAIATFTGNVRRSSRGKTVERLEYEAYPEMAVRAMAAIGADIERELQGTRVAIHHRVGTLQVGMPAVVIAASAPHRAEAFAACREAIERLKRDVPIWKKEVAIDGSEWIGQGP